LPRHAPAPTFDGAHSRGGDGNKEVYVMNANGSGQRSLTRNPAFDAEPAWSPDGRKIAFVSNRDGSYGVVTRRDDPGESSAADASTDSAAKRR
jgi:Tol biopolymer transport system component